jgi:hypothetical protein
LKQLRAKRFKPKFDEEEDRKLDAEISNLVTELMQVKPYHHLFSKIKIDD